MSGVPAMRSWRWLAALLLVLSLGGCAQGTTGQAGDPYSPASPANTGMRPEHGGGNLPGGGDM
jgi:hypothetical protein